MPSNAERTLIRKLRQKKYRVEFNSFIAEGPKVVRDLISSGLKPTHLFSKMLASIEAYNASPINEKDLKDLSSFENPDDVIAIFELPKLDKLELSQLVLILDRITDPGNLGTIIRTADWFGINTIYAVKGTADCFTPKVVQSTMGSIARVKMDYLEDLELFEKVEDRKLYYADMMGTSVNSFNTSKDNIGLIMGSESHGVSDFWREKASAITIDKIGGSQIESLNVAIAGAILMHKMST